MSWDTGALLFWFFALLGGLHLLRKAAKGSRTRERQMPAGLAATHVGFGVVGFLLWFVWVTSDNPEMGSARWLALVFLAVTAAAGVYQYKAYVRARADDIYGDRNVETKIHPFFVKGHMFWGVLAVAYVAVAAFVG
ncbi:MAG: hypothetical protein ACT4PW_03175 [Acidimicrobiia bacterium]